MSSGRSVCPQLCIVGVTLPKNCHESWAAALTCM